MVVEVGPEHADAETERLFEQRRLAAGYREAARRALAFARQYREEEGAPGGEREKACILQANAWRAVVRDLRAGRPVPPLPGLVSTRGDAATAAKQRSAG
jgi:hypothetical protein